MSVFRWKSVLIVCTALLGGITDARAAEWLNFYPVTGELSLDVDGRWKSFDSGESTWQIEYEEKLDLRLNGYSLDPRIFTFNVRLEPTLTQEKSDSPTVTISTDSTTLNYGANFRLLHGVPASPVSLSADFSANTDTTEGTLGNRRETTNKDSRAGLHWKFTPFQSTLDYKERSLDETFIPGFGQPSTERDEFQQTLTYRGKSRGMELFLEGNEFDDRTTLDQDYESERARLNNNFGWGKNSRLTSRLEYFNREGFSAEEKISVNESLRLQHTQNLVTTYGYGYRSLQRTTDTETHSGNFGLNHRLYTNLNTSLRLDGSTTQSDQFQDDSYNANLDFNYTKQIRPGVRLSANLGGGYSVSDRTGGQLDFTESRTATSIVVLVQRYIIWSTILVTAPGCNPCLDGTDYLVEDAGGDFTQIRIPAGSRIDIIVGDTITVDYVYQPPTVEYYGIPYRVGVRLEYAVFAFYHRTVGEDQTFVSGPDPTAVGDRRTDTTGIEWNWTWGRNKASVGVERVYGDLFDRTSTDYLLRQTLSYAVAPNAVLSATFSETFLRSDTDSDTFNGDVSVLWYPAPGLSVTPRISAFHRNVDPGGAESFMKAGVDVRWQWRNIGADLLYDHTWRDNDGASRVEDRVFLKLKRKF